MFDEDSWSFYGLYCLSQEGCGLCWCFLVLVIFFVDGNGQSWCLMKDVGGPVEPVEVWWCFWCIWFNEEGVW